MAEIIEERDGFRVKLVIEDAPEDPRKAFDHIVNVVTVHGSRYIDVDDDGGPFADEWERLLDRYEWSKAVDIFERWARTYGAAVTLYDTPERGATCVWYLTAEAIAQHEIPDPMAALKVERDEYRAWAEGDVWGYIIEKEVTWVPKDEPVIPRREMSTWEEVEDGSCWGFYGYDYAESSAREAFADFLARQSKG